MSTVCPAGPSMIACHTLLHVSRNSSLQRSRGHTALAQRQRQGACTSVHTWYYHPSDMSNCPMADSHLIAVIYSEINNIAQLCAKCYVVYCDKITDHAGWKKHLDRFYFNCLFNPYIKKGFKVIQSNDVLNCVYSSLLAERCWLCACICSTFKHLWWTYLALQIHGSREGDCA